MERVFVNEVGLRDGLQSLGKVIPTSVKLDMIEKLAQLGFNTIEISSFVNPRVMPAMADSSELTRLAPRRAGVNYRGFAPNLKGLELAIDAGIDEIGVAISASDAFNLKNIGVTAEQGMAISASMAERAQDAGITFGACVATVVWCPYEGYIEPSRVVDTVNRFLDMGAHRVYLGETIGRARSGEIQLLLKELESRGVQPGQIGAHFHDTYGQGIANYAACLDAGIRHFDTSLGGLGGCPFAPGSAGNVATEDFLYLLESSGLDSGLDLKAAATVNRSFCLDNGLPYTTKAGNAILGPA